MRIEDRYAIVSGIRTRYWQAGGAGSTVVLIHGVASCVEEWQPTFEGLVPHHTVIALDLVGCGLSAKPVDRSYAVESLTAFVLTFMRALEVGQAHLVGSSMGGHIALGCARSASDRVRSLSLLAPAGIGADGGGSCASPVRGLGAALARPSGAGMRMLLETAFRDPSRVTEALVDERLRFARLPGAPRASLKALRDLVGRAGVPPERVAGLPPWLPAVTAPTLVVWGRDDRIVPAAHAAVLERHLPQCRVAVYPQCGHLPQLEQPERLLGDLLPFLAEIDGRAAGPSALH